MSRRILITGGAGFVGQWLARALIEQGAQVFAGMLEGGPVAPVLDEKERGAICWTPLDVTSDESIRAGLESSQPERIVHLAGIAFAPEANAVPMKAFEVNALGALRLLSALPSSGAVRTLIVGSAEQYGAQDAKAYPIAESAALHPLTPYAAAKAAQELIALQLFRARGAAVICTRSFNHSGIGHGESYLLPTLVRRARELPRQGGSLRIGNGSVIRDYLHVADVVCAYLLLLERGTPGEVYNVCSGKGTSVREFADRVLKHAGVSAEISSDAALLRPVDVPILVGDNRKLRAATGWRPERSTDDIIDDLIHAAPR